MVEAATAVEPSEADISGKSAYHGAYFLLYRLHVLLSECNEHSRSRSYADWKLTLDAVFREIVWKMGVPERAVRDGLVKEKVIPALAEFNSMSGRKVSRQSVGGSADKVYTALAEYEILLRDVMGRAGLNMPGVDDPRFAFRKGK